MVSRHTIKIILILSIILINIGCDQVSKKIVRKNVQPYETIQVVKSYVIITNVENSGAFLSAGTSLSKSTKTILLMLLPVVAIVSAFTWLLLKRNISRTVLIGFCFVIGGGIGNIFDRITYGSVTDFLHIDLGFFHTGIFNMADMSIMGGIAILLIHFAAKKKKPAGLNSDQLS